MGGGWGGGICLNSPEISKNEGFANFNLFFTGPTPYFLKIIMCI